MSNEPLIKLEPNGTPSVVDYNVPETVAYDGTNIIELEVDPKMFNPPPIPPFSETELQALTIEAVTSAMTAGFVDGRLFPGFGLPPGALRYAETVPGPNGTVVPYKGCYLTAYGPQESELVWLTDRLRHLTPDEVWRNLREGRTLTIVRQTSHTYDHRFLEPGAGGAGALQQRIAIVEYHRLSSFLGAYGAGRTINTFSLLPGEKARITIKTYKRTTETTKEASTILDSLNDSSASDFETTVQDERSDKSTRARTDSWHVEGELTGNWGTGSARIEAGYKGSSSAAREQFSRRVESSLEKHVAQASNKRDIKVEQSTDATDLTGQEDVTERELRNINVGYALNFVFRQMNQEYVTLLHLTDVRVGYTDGITTTIVPLHALDEFLQQFIVTQKDGGGAPLPDDKQYRAQLRLAILDELRNVFDVTGTAREIIERVDRTDASGNPIGSYHRVKRGLKSGYDVPATGTRLTVDGLVLGAMYNVIRTEGIITEALLGKAPALDAYSQELQQQTVRELKARNDLLALQIAREQTAQTAVHDKRKAAVALLQKLYPPPTPTPAIPVVVTK